MKLCNGKCGQRKPLTEFYIIKKTGNHETKCKACRSSKKYTKRIGKRTLVCHNIGCENEFSTNHKTKMGCCKICSDAIRALRDKKRRKAESLKKGTYNVNLYGCRETDIEKDTKTINPKFLTRYNGGDSSGRSHQVSTAIGGEA